jgi:hypothetical protein
VLAIEPRGDDGGDKELRTIGVGASIRHREQSRLGVLQLEVLVFKLVAIDGFTARAVPFGKVAALEHEPGNDTVERGALVAKAVHACGELTEVLGRLWHDVVIEFEDDTSGVFAVDLDVEAAVLVACPVFVAAVLVASPVLSAAFSVPLAVSLAATLVA